jgi:hypothetical protein
MGLHPIGHLHGGRKGVELMGVVSDLVSNVGHMFGIGGGMNQFNAQGANLPQMDYATAIKQAMTNAGGISGQQQNLVNALSVSGGREWTFPCPANASAGDRSESADGRARSLRKEE